MGDRVLLLASGDLMARSRLEQAAARHGLELHSVKPGALAEALVEMKPEIVVLDLDSGTAAVLDDLPKAEGRHRTGPRLLGYFSHVDEGLGRAAAAAGVEAHPRGRFWRSIDDLLGASS